MRLLHQPDVTTIQETVTVPLGTVSLRFHALPLTHTLDTERELPSPVALNGDRDDPAFRVREMEINGIMDTSICSTVEERADAVLKRLAHFLTK